MRIERKLAELQTKLQEKGLNFEQSQRAGEYALLSAFKDMDTVSGAIRLIDVFLKLDKPMSSLFFWESTPEGHAYWQALDK